MIMLFEDIEINLIEDFQLQTKFFDQPVYRLPDTAEVRTIVKSIIDDDIWNTQWVDSSSKSAPPPDFYNEKQRLMMEVMRVDDHAFEQENGRITNPTIQRERIKEKELRRTLNLSPNTQLFINSPTDLPSLEDHNYLYYMSNFKRVVEKHKKQISCYRSNHLSHRLIFFIYDESSMYCQTDTPNQTIKRGERVDGLRALHKWFYDKAFTDVFQNSGIDYLVWFTPNKKIEQTGSPIVLPLACVYDCNQMNEQSIEYPPSYMMSLDE